MARNPVDREQYENPEIYWARVIKEIFTKEFILK